MKKGLTKIVFVIDRSGSMASVANDMIGGFNTFIQTQKSTNIGECRVSFNQFDDVYEEVYKNVLVNEVKDLTKETYKPRNNTALLDAVGRTINNVGEELSALHEDERPEQVLVVILTDGEENASREFTAAKIKEMITLQTETYKWQFMYIGANQDSWSVGQSLGIAGASTCCYVSSGANTKSSNVSLWGGLANKAVAYRACAGATMDFSDEERDEQETLIKTNKV